MARPEVTAVKKVASLGGGPIALQQVKGHALR